MRFNDRTSHMQAYPSLSSVVHEMWTPQTLVRLRLHPRATVTNPHTRLRRVTVCADDQTPLFRHGLERIYHDVQQGALDLVLESHNLQRNPFHVENDLHAVTHRARGD